MELVLTTPINNVMVDGYYDKKTAWFTREQIGSALEYEYPGESVGRIHNRHKERLDLFSRVSQVDLPSGGKQECFVYSIRGVFEICRWSKQPKADMVMDALYDMAESVVEKGYFSIVSDDQLIELLTNRHAANPNLFKNLKIKESEKKLLAQSCMEKELNDLWERREELSENQYFSQLARITNHSIARYNKEVSRYSRWVKSEATRRKKLLEARGMR